MGNIAILEDLFRPTVVDMSYMMGGTCVTGDVNSPGNLILAPFGVSTLSRQYNTIPSPLGLM